MKQEYKAEVCKGDSGFTDYVHMYIHITIYIYIYI